MSTKTKVVKLLWACAEIPVFKSHVNYKEDRNITGYKRSFISKDEEMCESSII